MGLRADAGARGRRLLRLPQQRDGVALVQQRRPVSWLVYADVKGGRETLNFSEWDRPQGEGAGDAVESVRNGSMPPIQYKPLHPAGRLTSAEREELARGLEKTLAADPPVAGG